MSSALKNKNKIGKIGDPYGILVNILNAFNSNFEIVNIISLFVIKLLTYCTMFFGISLLLRLYFSLLAFIFKNAYS